MTDIDFLATRFEAERSHLRAVAYRMLGSVTEADDAVQEAWIRLSRADSAEIDNLGGWLTTVLGRVCLNMLRTRRTRQEEPLDAHVPDPMLAPFPSEVADPESEAVLADSVGLALLVVLDALEPAERLAFVLHDMFAMPFDDIAPLVGRTPAAARQLASRARRRVQGATPTSNAGLASQRAVVDAFLAASRAGDFEALVEVLDPDITLRVDYGAGGVSKLVRGAANVASNALMYARRALTSYPVLVNGGLGMVSVVHGQLVALAGFTIRDGRIVEFDIIADPERLAAIDLAELGITPDE